MYFANKMVDLDLLKVYGANGSALLISLTDIDLVLKIVLVIVSIGYTATKWFKLMQGDKTNKK